MPPTMAVMRVLLTLPSLKIVVDSLDADAKALVGGALGEPSYIGPSISTVRGLEPSYGEMMPRRSSMSISRPARV